MPVAGSVCDIPKSKLCVATVANGLLANGTFLGKEKVRLAKGAGLGAQAPKPGTWPPSRVWNVIA